MIEAQRAKERGPNHQSSVNIIRWAKLYCWNTSAAMQRTDQNCGTDVAQTCCAWWYLPVIGITFFYQRKKLVPVGTVSPWSACFIDTLSDSDPPPLSQINIFLTSLTLFSLTSDFLLFFHTRRILSHPGSPCCGAVMFITEPSCCLDIRPE